MAARVLILIGAAGSGKDTVTRLIEERSEFRMFPMLTTRDMRPGESQGRPYTFVSEADYEAALAGGDLLNNIVVGGRRYGHPMRAFEDALVRGERLVLHAVHDWAVTLKARYPGMVLVLLRTPSIEEQVRRLRARGASDEEVARRMADPHVQDPSEHGVDLVLVNETGRQEDAASRILALLA